MSFQSTSKLNENLQQIKAEIYKYANLSRGEIFNQALNKRLKYTLLRYNDKIDQLSGYLLNQEAMRVLKAITKIQKIEDKKVIYENMKGAEDAQHSE